MSDGRSRCADDEEDWDAFRVEAKIPSSKWDVYSQESRFAKEGFEKWNLKGPLLVRYVDLQTEIRKLIDEGKQEDKQYAEYLRLQEIYGKR